MHGKAEIKAAKAERLRAENLINVNEYLERPFNMKTQLRIFQQFTLLIIFHQIEEEYRSCESDYLKWYCCKRRMGTLVGHLV